MKLQQANQLLEKAGAEGKAGRPAEAARLYRQVLAAYPDQPDLWYNLGLQLRADAQFEAALAAYGEAIKRGIEGAEEAYLNRAVILADHLRRENEAESELRQAIRLNPDFAPAILNLGNLLEERGARKEAIAAYEMILPSEDGSAGLFQDLRLEALARLAHLTPPQSLQSALLVQLEKAATSKAAVNPEPKANLNYALGRSFDSLGDYDRAMKAFRTANENVRKAGPAYDRRIISMSVDKLIGAFDDIQSNMRQEITLPRLVFICGMFRSGSTLVEQALAAHPDIIAGGELNLLNRIADIDLAPYPQSIRTLNDETAMRLAARYRSDIVKMFPDAKREGVVVTDKRPDNFLRIGLIKRLFPHAKIVHTIRNPIDTCLSVYFQHIDQGLVGYASDLADTAHYFGEYRRMMAHWKSIHADEIFDFDYDRFVSDPRSCLEPLLTFLGLPWSDKCLSFHEVKNTVKTASYWQVRRPLYKDSSGRRRNYAAHATPIISELEIAGVEV